jgi:DNA-binding response OmpR family regulator
VPILVLTKEPHSGLRSAFMPMGASEVIAKPFTAEAFAAAVERARRTATTRAAEA